jgi:quercetin dioxygenase-like cupin family protein
MPGRQDQAECTSDGRLQAGRRHRRHARLIDLEKQPANIKDRELRFRKLTIEPGGIVPWHSHDDRPAVIYVQQGEIVEYASNCIDPIMHKAGDLRPEVFGTSHWWKNLGKETVILYVGDVRKDPQDHNM